MAGWVRKMRPEGRDEMMNLVENGGVVYLSFPALDQTGFVTDAFSTRLGGVSSGVYASMNLSYNRGDDPGCVYENYRRMAASLGVGTGRMVTSHQTHTTNIRVVSENDCGKGVERERDYHDVDGLITNIPRICLVAFFADCVPLYFLDPVNKAIGLSHSGWRGTAARMAEVTLESMKREFGTDPENVTVCIGPSICRDCYEVGEDVISEFRAQFSPDRWKDIYDKKNNGKYQLDLWEANRIILTEAGIKPSSIHITDICTRCNPELLFSHRYMGDKRGNAAAFLALR